MICGNCGAENRPDRKFCLRCGTALAARCPNCGSTNEPEAAFCGECGTHLASGDRDCAGPSASCLRREPSSERRLVTVLFADLVGFTTVAEGLDAEDTRDLLGRYFEAVARDRRALRRHRREVHRRRGDGRLGRADGTRGRCRARRPCGARPGRRRARAERPRAAGARGRADRRGRRHGRCHRPGHGGWRPRQHGQPAPGRSRRRARSWSARRRTGPRATRSRSSPPATRCSRARSRRWRRGGRPRVIGKVRGAGRSEFVEPPFVGRDAEFAVLKERLHATSRDGRARLVSLTGVAGIGKSRLVWELEKYADGIVELVYWHQGRSLAYGEGISFWALGEMVRRRAGIAERDDAATTDAKLADDGRGVLRGRRRAALDPIAAARPARARGPGRRATRRAVRRLAAPVRADRVAGDGRARVRGPPVGGRRPDRVHRLADGVVAAASDPDRHAGAARAVRAPADLGRGPARLHAPSTWSRCRRPR